MKINKPEKVNEVYESSLEYSKSIKLDIENIDDFNEEEKTVKIRLDSLEQLNFLSEIKLLLNLHISDNYGLDPYIRRELNKVFPGIELQELPAYFRQSATGVWQQASQTNDHLNRTRLMAISTFSL